ncbi:hypothetical protein QBC34DRAFT_461580 [Podospora aff. communis PSN243]|uniref:F-box domain-containing protein n=1 Tax=Podospora aff. communis PSN243 TaxID=3040156 RepID=A0AAV9GPX8_9PEZI|nr:hypothetical protein QBC34DRAFT_461580 [Podospora aff. communis PSN243]
MSRLETLPTEILCEIFGWLVVRDPDSRMRRLGDISSLRLTNKAIGALADAIFMEEVVFCPCSKRDVDMVLAIAAHPMYSRYLSTLTLTLEMMSRDRLSGLEYDRALRMRKSKQLPKVTEKFIWQQYHLYERFFDEQSQLFDNDLEIFEELAANLPNVRELVVSLHDALRQVLSPFKKCSYDLQHARLSRWDWNDLSNQATSLFRAFRESTHLQVLRVGAIPFGFFHPVTFMQGNHCMMGNFLGNITTFELAILVYLDSETAHPSAFQIPEVEERFEECREVMGKGALRSILDGMPNLVNLTIRFAEDHMFDMGTFDAPATLRSFIAPNQVWPKLRKLAIDNVETERSELAGFIALHKDSLATVYLQSMRFTSTSWMKFFPDLKSRLVGSEVDLFVSGILRGRCENEERSAEGWNLGGEICFQNVMDDDDDDDDDDDTLIRIAITDYVKSPNQTLPCPLTFDNMYWTFESGAEGSYGGWETVGDEESDSE